MPGSSMSTGRQSVGGLGCGKVLEDLKQPGWFEGLISFFILILTVIEEVMLLFGRGVGEAVVAVMEVTVQEVKVWLMEKAVVMARRCGGGEWEVVMRVSAFIDHFCARHYAKHFRDALSFYPHSSPVRLGIFLYFLLRR